MEKPAICTGGTVHTVWSPDLDCEFENHGDTVSGQAQFAHFSDGHTEFGLSLLDRFHRSKIAQTVSHAGIWIFSGRCSGVRSVRLVPASFRPRITLTTVRSGGLLARATLLPPRLDVVRCSHT